MMHTVLITDLGGVNLLPAAAFERVTAKLKPGWQAHLWPRSKVDAYVGKSRAEGLPPPVERTDKKNPKIRAMEDSFEKTFDRSKVKDQGYLKPQSISALARANHKSLSEGIMEFLKKNPNMTAQQVADGIGSNRISVGNALYTLRRRGFVTGGRGRRENNSGAKDHTTWAPIDKSKREGWTEEQVLTLINMASEGYYALAIAEATGKTVGAIWSKCFRDGIVINRERRA
jgi:hypothetical protein